MLVRVIFACTLWPFQDPLAWSPIRWRASRLTSHASTRQATGSLPPGGSRCDVRRPSCGRFSRSGGDYAAVPRNAAIRNAAAAATPTPAITASLPRPRVRCAAAGRDVAALALVGRAAAIQRPNNGGVAPLSRNIHRRARRAPKRADARLTTAQQSLPDRRHHLIRRGWLSDESEGLGEAGCVCLSIGGHDDDRQPTVAAVKLGEQRAPVHERHVDIGDDHIRSHAAQAIACSSTVAGRGDHEALLTEDVSDEGAPIAVIIHHQHRPPD